MKQFLLFLSVSFLLGLSPAVVHAQGMMGGYANPNTTVSPETAATTEKDEAEGKAVWDKLQNKQVSCADLTDDDYDVLGDFFMGSMMGANHSAMNQMMAQRLGDAGEKQMHIAMGKRLSGCDTNAALPSGASYFMPMMGFTGTEMMNGSRGSWGTNARGMMGYAPAEGRSFGILRIVTWLAIILFFLSGTLFFLKEIQRKKSK